MKDHKMEEIMGQPVTVREGAFVTPLSFPNVLGETAILTAQNTTANLAGFGNVSVLGYQVNNLLGPTIKVQSGTAINVILNNQLKEKTNIHWHGLKIPADMDGHPENTIDANSSFNYKFNVDQRAGLYWYHPHPDMLTGKQVFQGLAGLFIVNDAEEAKLNLPSGTKEIPLVIQDKRISSGNIPYAPTSMEQMTGFMGQFVLVNGVYAPMHNVETAQYRVRVLNGSNARIYNLALSNNATFTLIGNDGGLLANPESINELLIGPGERADLIIDFSKTAINTELYLVSKMFTGGSAQGKQEFKIMKFKTTSAVQDNFSLPAVLSTIAALNEGMATKTRNFDIQNNSMSMSGNMMSHTINDKAYDKNRIDELVSSGATEVWIFDNTKGEEPHPMHIHGVQFQILSRTGGRGALTPLEKGWKDMALCMPGEKVKIIVPFNTFSGKFIYHCHNLEHEDSGMMGQFEIK